MGRRLGIVCTNESQSRLARADAYHVSMVSPIEGLPLRSGPHEDPVGDAVDFRRKSQNTILVCPLPQLVPIFLDLGVHRVGIRSVSGRRR